MDERVQNIVEALEELFNDNTVPRNIKSKVEEVISCLKDQNGEEMSIKINKALTVLDEISDDTNLQSYTRTQIWNIASMLEMI
ncbi:UPF0147 family protein [Candidatus Woesearchaeota archaeon]|nr:UPF0147 family protein [Candidatus Woesearchaeota archaeon]